jgi:type IV pilus assembly protein PilA
MHSEKGFSLLELLIVVAIILVIAAIAIPNLLRSKMSANEASAVGSLHAIGNAENLYLETYPTVGFASQLAALGGPSPCTPSSTTACIVDNFLVNAIPGTTGKSGYVFLATGSAVGGTTYNNEFVIGAAPMSAQHTGSRDFCTMSDGALHSQSASPGDVPVDKTASCDTFPVVQ